MVSLEACAILSIGSHIQDLKRSAFSVGDSALGVLSGSVSSSRLTRLRGVASDFTRASCFSSSSHGNFRGIVP
jgi:hypothetical protein